MSDQAIRKRYDYLDIAKAISIFLVLIGHTTANNDTTFFRLVLYTFHMPLFFMVSGVVMRAHRDNYDWKHWCRFFRKTFFSLFVPYFIWALIYCSFNFANTAKILYGSWQELTQAKTVTSLWFLPCLILARTFMEFVLMFSKRFSKLNRHIYAAIVSIPAFAVGFSLPKISNGYPWCFDVAFVALGFMLIGYSLKERLIALHSRKLRHITTLLVMSTALFVVFIIMQGNKLPLILMCAGDYGNVFYFLIEAFSACSMILLLSIVHTVIFVERRNSKIRHFILWVGGNTKGILLLHKPFLQEIVVKHAVALGLPMPNLFVAIACAAVTLPVCCVGIIVIKRFFPQLLGTFPYLEKKMEIFRV
ncbi:MAG: acyltransferase family protein [Synergistaceae bacterium]|nr:acyltransferase family protein [Synergistaceae bacterium]